MKLVSEQDYETLRKVVFSNQILEVRLRAQVAVLYEKDFQIGKIKKVTEKSKNEIYYLLSYVDFFGIENYLEIPFEELISRVNEEYFKKEQAKARLRRKGFFYYLFWPITSIFRTLIHFGRIFAAFLVWLHGLFSSYKPKSRNSNIATFEKGASNNYLIQINKLIVNDNEEKESVVVERFIAESENELQGKIKELIASEEETKFNNKAIDSLIEKARRRDNDGNLDSSWVQIYAGLIVAYLLYSSSIKGGVWSISVFGMAILITVRTCTPNSNQGFQTKPLVSPDSISIQNTDSVVVDAYKLDSIRNKIQANQPVEIYDYNTYFNIIEEFYERDNLCNALSAVGQRQKKFIYEYDRIDHKSQNYYIDSYNQRYYVHVVAYSDVRQAAFQMHFLNSSEIFDARILRVNTTGSMLYAVVIGEYSGHQIKEICELVDKWETFCFNNEVEIGCYYNG